MQPCKNRYAFIWIGVQRLLSFSFGPKLFCPPAFLSVIIFEGILPLTSPQVIELKFNVIYDVQLVTINRRNRKQIISKNLLLLPSLSLHVRNKQLTRFYLYKTICKMPFCFCVQLGRRLDGAWTARAGSGIRCNERGLAAGSRQTSFRTFCRFSIPKKLILWKPRQHRLQWPVTTPGPFLPPCSALPICL